MLIFDQAMAERDSKQNNNLKFSVAGGKIPSKKNNLNGLCSEGSQSLI